MIRNEFSASKFEYFQESIRKPIEIDRNSPNSVGTEFSPKLNPKTRVTRMWVTERSGGDGVTGCGVMERRRSSLSASVTRAPSGCRRCSARCLHSARSELLPPPPPHTRTSLLLTRCPAALMHERGTSAPPRAAQLVRTRSRAPCSSSHASTATAAYRPVRRHPRACLCGRASTVVLGAGACCCCARGSALPPCGTSLFLPRAPPSI